MAVVVLVTPASKNRPIRSHAWLRKPETLAHYWMIESPRLDRLARPTRIGHAPCLAQRHNCLELLRVGRD